MRLLIDECVPKRMGRHLANHEVLHVTTMGWSGKKNGELIQLLTANQIDVLITVDRNLYHQQQLSNVTFSVIVLIANSNKLADLLLLVPEIITTLNFIQPSKVIEIT